MTKLMLLVLLPILFTGIANAQPSGQVVINSADWVDVYSAISFANFKGMPYHFTINEPHARVITQYMDKNLDVYLIESEAVPYIANYRDTLSKSGLKVVNETSSSDGRKLNIKLAGELDLNNFIVIDDGYGYNAISVAPYAVKSKSWVIFADSNNIDDVYEFLKGRNVENLLIYGYADSVVKEKLNEFNPELIDEGNRFYNNLEIVKKYMEISPKQDAIFTNGDFIEASIMAGDSPVIFIGAQTVPLQVIDYLKASKIKGGTLIGNDLTGSARKLKESTGMTIFVKFGQGRQMTGEMSLVEELDKFYLPGYVLSLDAILAQYNEVTKQLEIQYDNDAGIGEFFKSSTGVFVDGKRIATVSDDAVQYIEAESTSGRAYNVDLTDYSRKSNITAHVSAEFGEDAGSLNLLLTKILNVGIISVKDNSEMVISDIRYNTGTQRIELELKNTGSVKSYASPAITLRISGKDETLRPGNAIPFSAGETNTSSLRVELTDADLADNPEVRVQVSYGERPALLVKSVDKKLPLNVTGGTPATMIGLVSAILLLLIGMIYKHKAGAKVEKCVKCGTKRPAGAEFCPKCGISVRK